MMNRNLKSIETTAAMSAPGGKALTGYINPHTPAVTITFRAFTAETNQRWRRVLF
jgi:hypothetical protein